MILTHTKSNSPPLAKDQKINAKDRGYQKDLIKYPSINIQKKICIANYGFVADAKRTLSKKSAKNLSQQLLLKQPSNMAYHNG
jgi:hypothetical protein